jgi:hypothetical protein
LQLENNIKKFYENWRQLYLILLANSKNDYGDNQPRRMNE